MGPSIVEILSKAIEMDMVFGQIIRLVNKATKDIICLIRNMDMEYMTGQMGIYIKEISFKIRDVEKANYFITMI